MNADTTFLAADHPANRDTARLIERKTWADTPLGPFENWPQSLRGSVDVMLDSPVAMVLLWGPELVQVYNDGFAEILGWKHPTALGQRHRECWPEAWGFTGPMVESVRAGQVRVFRDTMLRLHRHGIPEEAWFDMTCSPVPDDRGGIGGVLVTLVETTAKVRAEAAAKASERRLAIAVEASRGGVFEHRVPLGPELHHSPRWCEILGFSEADVPAWQNFQTWHDDRIHPEDRPARDAAFLAFVNGTEPGYALEFRMRHKSGAWIWVREVARAIERRHDGSVALLSGLMLDITERKSAERDAAHLSRHDPVTELPNRALLQERLGEVLREAVERCRQFAMILIDIDGFRAVNDSLGREGGDRVLKLIAKRIRPVLRKGDMLARLGGDEFVLLLPSVRTRDDAEGLAQRVHDALRPAATVEGKTVEVSASFGISIFPEDGSTRSDMLRHADLALRQAKAAGRGAIRFYDASSQRADTRRQRTEIDLRRAIELDQLVLHYQPQFDLRTGEVRSLEALLRWRKSEPETIYPDQFMQVAEESGLILPMGQWVLRQAAEQAARWREDGFDAAVAVNISPAEASRPEFLPSLDRIVAETGIEPGRLELEITEALLAEQRSPEFEAFVDGCRERGVGLVIDDFGIGAESLDDLGGLAASKIKIDRSFIAAIGDPERQTLVEAVVEIGHRLKRRVVAEGVETQAQLDFLRAAGCDDAQGMLLCPPGEAYTIEDRLIVGLDPAPTA